MRVAMVSAFFRSPLVEEMFPLIFTIVSLFLPSSSRIATPVSSISSIICCVASMRREDASVFSWTAARRSRPVAGVAAAAPPNNCERSRSAATSSAWPLSFASLFLRSAPAVRASIFSCARRSSHSASFDSASAVAFASTAARAAARVSSSSGSRKSAIVQRAAAQRAGSVEAPDGRAAALIASRRFEAAQTRPLRRQRAWTTRRYDALVKGWFLPRAPAPNVWKRGQPPLAPR
mmetsp:Transcript_22780/g.71410  ORF Transcript_22780/g.71410 Transcript_22780/m.71410 type:complete len:234 (+) Transcript_22780:52-753(+)